MESNSYPFNQSTYEPGLHDIIRHDRDVDQLSYDYNPGLHDLIDQGSGGSRVGRKLLAVLAVGLAGVGVFKSNLEESSLEKPALPESPTLEVPVELPGAEILPTDRYMIAMDRLLGQISSGEGGYDSVNTGKAGDTGVGSPGYINIFGERNLSQLTIREILELQDSDRIFAVGRFQFIPKTFGSAVSATNIDIDRVFDGPTQNELAVNYLIMGGKRPNLTAYIRGEDVSLEQAVEDLCKEFASMPCLDGYGRYDNDRAGNKAFGGLGRVEEIKRDLIELRSAYMEMNMPSAVLIGDSLSVGYKDYGGILEVDNEFGLRLDHVDSLESRPLVGNESDGLNAINNSAEMIKNTDIVVIGLGTNAVESDDRYQSGIHEAIKRIHEISDNPDIKVAFVTNYSYKEGTKSSERRNRRNEILDAVADSYDNVFLIDMHELREVDVFSGDGVHLTGDGYKLASRIILRQVAGVMSA